MLYFENLPAYQLNITGLKKQIEDTNIPRQAIYRLYVLFCIMLVKLIYPEGPSSRGWTLQTGARGGWH